MAYTVLARKYRSRTFDEVIGQEPIATTLVNAIKVGRIHHGYLFTGTRGVGKTSMARILAKALNCLKYDAPTTTPCGECDVCRAVAEGQDVDVLEIDAASNTGVDNIRELRSNTAYRPARSRFKVYIIDEVHMLSTGAFNALLKTLEEPPDHVKFILATTEIQKVPATIQSRCQRFNFRNIGAEAIAKRLAEIVKAEESKAEDVVIQRIARLANGSMRDALSILDQLLSVSPKKLDAKVLDEILPPAQDERIFGLLRHAAEGNAAAVLTDLDGILSAGQGLEVFCSDAIEMVRTLVLIRTCGPDATMVDVPAGSRDEYVELSRKFELSHYVQMIPMLEELRRNARYSGAGRALTEAVMVRFARMHEWASIEQLLRELPADARTRSAGAGPADTSAEKKKNLPPAEVATADPTASDRAKVPPRQVAAGAPPAVERRLASERAAQRSESADNLPPIPVPDGNYDDAQPPDDYIPPEAELRTSAPARPAGELVRKELSAAERSKVEQDPVVRQTIDLFDGIVIRVEQSAPQP